MESYARSNFLPSLPASFGKLGVDALNHLEMGGDPFDGIFCPDVENTPKDATVVPGGWTLPALEIIEWMHLDGCLSEHAIDSINDYLARPEDDLPLR